MKALCIDKEIKNEKYIQIFNIDWNGKNMLTQSEADFLIGLPKIRKDDEKYPFPLGGDTMTIPVISKNGTENFLIDVNRGKIRLSKCTYQERYLEPTILIRLDVDGPPHSNPEVTNAPLPYLEPYNGQIIKCPHLHVYVEDFMDKWAIPAPLTNFSNTTNLFQTLHDFFEYCNVIKKPIFWRQSLNEL